MPDKILKEVEYTKVNGGFTPASESVIREIALEIFVDRQHFATAMILATLEKEFVIGHLFGQGIIGGIKDIASLTIKGTRVEVTLSGNARGRRDNNEIHSDLVVSREDVFACVRAILKSDIFSATEAVHSAGLFAHGREAICIAEDLGRHNALDKVIGYRLMNDTDFSKTLAASTGRQPLEMILRCRNANIPIIATKGVPTTLAVETATQAGITIAGLVRGDAMIVYSHPSRIT